MIAYTVHEPNVPAIKPLERADAVVFVKEGVAWLAFFFPVFWLLAQRMWIELAVFIGISLGITLFLMKLGVSGDATLWLTMALGIVLAVSANDLRRWKLERAGYRTVAAVNGLNRTDSELKFFSIFVEDLNTQSSSALINENNFGNVVREANKSNPKSSRSEVGVRKKDA